jgi:hypothetical protein
MFSTRVAYEARGSRPARATSDGSAINGQCWSTSAARETRALHHVID